MARMSSSIRLCFWLISFAAIGCSAPSSSSTSFSRGGGRDGGFANPLDFAGSNGGQNPLTPTAAPRTGAGGKVCASALVQTAKNDPTIEFVIDGSGSMCAPFGSDGATRWQALRAALLDPSKGLIQRLQSSVRFGATLFDGTIDATLAVDGVLSDPPCALLSSLGKDMGMCPELIDAPPQRDNASAIDTLYPMVELGGSTPTDKALGHVMDALIASRVQQGPDDKAQSPVYVVLATDGAPNDICVDGTGGDGSAQRQGVLDAVDRGAAAGITTWVISLADGDPTLQMHLDDVARHGDPKNPNARTFSPTNPDDLIMTLAQLLGGAIGCHIALNGTVTVGQECLGAVEESGRALPCCQETSPGSFTCARMPTTAPDGWRLSDPHSLELLGDTCTRFLVGSGDLLSATFPCEVFMPD